MVRQDGQLCSRGLVGCVSLRAKYSLGFFGCYTHEEMSPNSPLALKKSMYYLIKRVGKKLKICASTAFVQIF